MSAHRSTRGDRRQRLTLATIPSQPEKDRHWAQRERREPRSDQPFAQRGWPAGPGQDQSSSASGSASLNGRSRITNPPFATCSRDCLDSWMGIKCCVPITRSGLPCLPPPPAPRRKYPWGAPHRAVRSTAVAAPKARCAIVPYRRILPPGWRFRMTAPGRLHRR